MDPSLNFQHHQASYFQINDQFSLDSYNPSIQSNQLFQDRQRFLQHQQQACLQNYGNSFLQDPQHANYPQYAKQPQYLTQNPRQTGVTSMLPHFGIDPAFATNTLQTELKTSIKSLEYRLDHGSYKCYLIWLCFLMFAAIINFGQTIIYGIEIGHFAGYIPSLLSSILLFWQSLVEVKAIRTKNLKRANHGIILMVIYTVLNFVAIIIFTIWSSSFNTHSQDWHYQSLLAGYVFVLLTLYGCLLFVHLCITLLGAFKVRNLLRKRKTLIERLNLEYSDIK